MLLLLTSERIPSLYDRMAQCQIERRIRPATPPSASGQNGPKHGGSDLDEPSDLDLVSFPFQPNAVGDRRQTRHGAALPPEPHSQMQLTY